VVLEPTHERLSRSIRAGIATSYGEIDCKFSVRNKSHVEEGVGSGVRNSSFIFITLHQQIKSL